MPGSTLIPPHMDSSAIQNLVSELTDLELAVLLALVCQEHCVIETPLVNLDNVSNELALVFFLSLLSFGHLYLTEWILDLRE